MARSNWKAAAISLAASAAILPPLSTIDRARADTKVSDLPPAAALTGPELFYCVQGGLDKKCTYSQMSGPTGAQISGVPVNGQLATWINATTIQGVTALPAANFPALTGDVTSVAGSYATAIKANVALAGSPTAATQAPGDNSTKIATTAYADAAVAANPQARVLLNTLSPAAAPTAEDLTSLTAAYDAYDIVFENVKPATANVVCQLQVHSGGVFKTTGYLTQVLAYLGGSGTTAAPTTYIPCSAVTSQQIATTEGITGILTVYQPSVTTYSRKWIGHFAYAGSAAFWNVSNVGQWTDATAAIDGFQIFFSSGNIASGTIKIYGIK